MKRVSFFVAMMVMFVAMGCEKVLVGKIEDKPEIAFEENQMIVPTEGGEFYVPVTSTGIDSASILEDSNWVRDENGDLLPIEEWIEVVKVVNEYEAEATRALAKWNSAIVISVKPNDTGYSRNATLTARSFALSDQIIIRQAAMAE